MSTFQKVIVCGHLGDDPQTRHFGGGGQVSNISVATTETWNDRQTGEKMQKTEWHKIQLSGKLSELTDKYLRKGSKVLIEGKLNTRKYTDNAGIERYVTEIQASNLHFMGTAETQKTDPSSNAGSVNDYKDKSNEEPDDLPF